MSTTPLTSRPTPMDRPLLLAVDDDPDRLRDVERELCARYEPHYRVRCLTSAEEALATLAQVAARGEEVALLLVGEKLDGRAGTAVLTEARRMFPHAQRVLLVGWGRLGDASNGHGILEAISRGHTDHYVIRPDEPPDEKFHQAISGFLLVWAESRRRAPHTVDVVGYTWSGRSYELRAVLERCALPHRFHLAESDEGRAILNRVRATKLPLLVMPDGNVLEDPSDMQIAAASGTAVAPDREHYDLVVIGGGPAGLSAGVYGASEGLQTLLIDSGGLGGQATSSASIRNYLGFPRGVTGGELARRAYEQAWIFGARFAFMQPVTELRQDNDGIVVTLDTGGVVVSRVVVLAMGAHYRQLGVESIESYNGAGVFYGAAAAEAPLVSGQDVYVVGGANSAGQAVLHLARYAKHVTLVVRASSLAAKMSHYLIRQIEATPNVDVRTGTEVVAGGGHGWLEHLVLREQDSRKESTVNAQALFLMIGARPHTEWLPSTIERDADGFVVTGSDLPAPALRALDRRPLALETSMPGVLAAGDVRHGSVKRVASAVGEGSIAIQLAHQLLSAQSD